MKIEMQRRLKRLCNALDMAIKRDNILYCMPELFSVFSYLWTSHNAFTSEERKSFAKKGFHI